jgi:hypothetical protein
MPSFAAFINQADEVGLDSLLIADGLGWGDEWYRMTGASSNFIHIAQQALAEYGELSSETIYKWTRDNLQSGKWSSPGLPVKRAA